MLIYFLLYYGSFALLTLIGSWDKCMYIMQEEENAVYTKSHVIFFFLFLVIVWPLICVDSVMEVFSK